MTLAELMDRGAELRWRAISGGLLRLTELTIVVDPRVHNSPRHFAACCEDVSEIRIAPELAQQPDPVIDGILMHEIGHAADFAYPARWRIWRELGGAFPVTSYVPSVVTPRPASRGTPTIALYPSASHSQKREWKRRDPYKVEVDADTLAEAIFDVRIGYAGELMLQSTEGGVRPRPFGL